MASVLKVNEIQHTGGTSAFTIDSSGRMATPNRPMFKVQRSANQELGSADNGDKITGFDDDTSTGTVNVGNMWDTTNDKATAPVTGMYHFEFHAFVQPGTSGQFGIGLYVNGSTAGGRDYRYVYSESGYTSVNFNSTVYLQASDYIEFYFIQHSGTAQMHLSSGAYYGGVAGYLIG